MTTYINNLMMLGSEADVWELKPEDWMANLAVAGVVDDEAKIEFFASSSTTPATCLLYTSPSPRD